MDPPKPTRRILSLLGSSEHIIMFRLTQLKGIGSFPTKATDYFLQHWEPRSPKAQKDR